MIKSHKINLLMFAALTNSYVNYASAIEGDETGSNARVLEEVIVTASKRAETL